MFVLAHEQHTTATAEKKAAARTTTAETSARENKQSAKDKVIRKVGEGGKRGDYFVAHDRAFCADLGVVCSLYPISV